LLKNICHVIHGIVDSRIVGHRSFAHHNWIR
jgi:hypothetical protein